MAFPPTFGYEERHYSPSSASREDLQLHDCLHSKQVASYGSSTVNKRVTRLFHVAPHKHLKYGLHVS